MLSGLVTVRTIPSSGPASSFDLSTAGMLTIRLHDGDIADCGPPHEPLYCSHQEIKRRCAPTLGQTAEGEKKIAEILFSEKNLQQRKNLLLDFFSCFGLRTHLAQRLFLSATLCQTPRGIPSLPRTCLLQYREGKNGEQPVRDDGGAILTLYLV